MSKLSASKLQILGTENVEKIIGYMIDERDKSIFDLDVDKCETIYDEDFSIELLLKLLGLTDLIEIKELKEHYAVSDEDVAVNIIEECKYKDSCQRVEVYGINLILESIGRDWDCWKKKPKGMKGVMQEIESIIDGDKLRETMQIYYNRLKKLPRLKGSTLTEAKSGVASLFRYKNSKGAYIATALPFNYCSRVNFYKWIAKLPDEIRDEHDSDPEYYIKTFQNTFDKKVEDFTDIHSFIDWINDFANGKEVKLCEHKNVMSIVKKISDCIEQRVVLKELKVFKIRGYKKGGAVPYTAIDETEKEKVEEIVDGN